MYEDQIHRAFGIFEHKNNVREHFPCVQEIFDLYKTRKQLGKLSNRPDLDTICALKYLKMKKFALNEHGLSFKDNHPEAQGISVPKLELTTTLFDKKPDTVL